MLRKFHAAAGSIALLTIFMFWTSTAVTEFLGTYYDIAFVKISIRWSLMIVVPLIIFVALTGFIMSRGSKDPLVLRKKRRLLLFALNGLMVLVPASFYLADRADAGLYDDMFHALQMLLLIAGALNITLLSLNIKDGLKLSEKKKNSPKSLKK